MKGTLKNITEARVRGRDSYRLIHNPHSKTTRLMWTLSAQPDHKIVSHNSNTELSGMITIKGLVVIVFCPKAWTSNVSQFGEAAQFSEIEVQTQLSKTRKGKVTDLQGFIVELLQWVDLLWC